MATPYYIKKIRLNNGAVYNVYDTGAPRIEDLENYLPLTGGNITGNLTVDQQLYAGTLKIESIEYHIGDFDGVLIQSSDGTIKKRSLDTLLEDIGGCSYSINDVSGLLSFKKGK